MKLHWLQIIQVMVGFACMVFQKFLKKSGTPSNRMIKFPFSRKDRDPAAASKTTPRPAISFAPRAPSVAWVSKDWKVKTSISKWVGQLLCKGLWYHVQTMSQKYPLGRIHPHGSGGKSVYQNAYEASKQISCPLITVVSVIVTIGLVTLGFWMLFTVPELWMIPLFMAWGLWVKSTGE